MQPQRSNSRSKIFSPPVSKANFPQTRWSLVVDAGATSVPRRRKALEELCSIYWDPLYAFARRSGSSPEDAADMTQDYFSKLLSKDVFGGLEEGNGRLRSYLLAGLKNFVTDTWRKESAASRGGGQKLLSIDAEAAEDRYLREPTDDRSPDVIFDRRWALTLLQNAYERLERSYSRRGRGQVFVTLKPFLEWHGDDCPYSEAATKLGLTENAVQQQVFRMRRQFRRALEAEVAETVATPEEIEAELDCLVAVLG